MGDLSVEQTDKDNRSAGSSRSLAGGLLFLLGACVLAWLLMTFGNAPLPASGILAATLGWLFYRWAGLNQFGVLLWCLATVAAYAVAENRTAFINGDAVMEITSIVGVLSFLIAAFSFLVAAVSCRARRGRNFAGLALVLFSLLYWGAEAYAVHCRIAYQREIQETTRTLIDLHRLGNDVESFRAKFRRLPLNEEELVSFRGKPMPIHWDTYSYTYQKIDDDRYYLNCCVSNPWGRHWDLWGYLLHYYGPTSTQRIHTELF